MGKVENYKRIKLEEAAARAELMNDPCGRGEISSAKKGRKMLGDLSSLAVHRRNPSHFDHKYKPSAHALDAYPPLREGPSHFVSQQALPRFVPSVGNGQKYHGIISSQELHGIRGMMN